jgi:hypothetical protein
MESDRGAALPRDRAGEIIDRSAGRANEPQRSAGDAVANEGTRLEQAQLRRGGFDETDRWRGFLSRGQIVLLPGRRAGSPGHSRATRLSQQTIQQITRRRESGARATGRDQLAP